MQGSGFGRLRICRGSMFMPRDVTFSDKLVRISEYYHL